MNKIAYNNLVEFRERFRPALATDPGWFCTLGAAVPSLALAIGDRSSWPESADSSLHGPRSPVRSIMHGIGKLLGTDLKESNARPMRDADKWSDQAEVDFYEQRLR